MIYKNSATRQLVKSCGDGLLKWPHPSQGAKNFKVATKAALLQLLSFFNPLTNDNHDPYSGDSNAQVTLLAWHFMIRLANPDSFS